MIDHGIESHYMHVHTCMFYSNNYVASHADALRACHAFLPHDWLTAIERK